MDEPWGSGQPDQDVGTVVSTQLTSYQAFAFDKSDWSDDPAYDFLKNAKSPVPISNKACFLGRQMLAHTADIYNDKAFIGLAKDGDAWILDKKVNRYAPYYHVDADDPLKKDFLRDAHNVVEIGNLKNGCVYLPGKDLILSIKNRRIELNTRLPKELP